MNDTEKVEELTKALQDGKKLINRTGCRIASMSNGVVCVCSIDKPNLCDVNATLYSEEGWFVWGGVRDVKDQEPPFEITENQLAEYECRDGSKAICYGIPNDRYSNYPYRVLYYSGNIDSVTIDGRVNISVEITTDLIRKIRDL